MEMEESDGVSSTQTTVGSDTEEDTENTTVFVQIRDDIVTRTCQTEG